MTGNAGIDHTEFISILLGKYENSINSFFFFWSVKNDALTLMSRAYQDRCWGERRVCEVV